MTKSINERELVLGILLEVTRDGEHSHIALRNVLNKYQYLDKKERAFITRVTEGTKRRRRDHRCLCSTRWKGTSHGRGTLWYRACAGERSDRI